MRYVVHRRNTVVKWRNINVCKKNTEVCVLGIREIQGCTIHCKAYIKGFKGEIQGFTKHCKGNIKGFKGEIQGCTIHCKGDIKWFKGEIQGCTIHCKGDVK